MFHVKLDNQALQHIKKSLSPDVLRRVLRNSVNAAARTARKESILEIQKKLNIKGKDISKRARVRTAKGGSTTSEMKFYAVPLSLDRFPTDETPTGLKVSVYKTQGSQIIPSAFMAHIKGKKMPFVRTKAITQAAKPFVVRPSKSLPFRSPKGHALPINKLWADPDANIVIEKINSITDIAQRKGTERLLQDFDKAFESGKI